MKAIREVIRNAIVHRDYSLTGKDVKVAIYDDMVEITSPGLLPPSIDYSAMESRQSDVRNKVIAPVFKRLGIIDQWGNGLKLIANEMRDYPHIGLQWKEVGMSFQVQFVKLDCVEEQELESVQDGVHDDMNSVQDNLDSAQDSVIDDKNSVIDDEGSVTDSVIDDKNSVVDSVIDDEKILAFSLLPKSRKEIMDMLGLIMHTKNYERHIVPLLKKGLLSMTFPDKPTSKNQKYIVTEKGKELLNRKGRTSD